jgi:hypothetical protein
MPVKVHRPSALKWPQLGVQQQKKRLSALFVFLTGGSGEIRTHERRKTLPVFKTGAIDHSATLPLSVSF